MLDCPAVDALLEAHLAGALSAPRAADVERHLARCGACREQRRRAVALVGWLDVLDAPATPPAPAPAPAATSPAATSPAASPTTRALDPPAVTLIAPPRLPTRWPLALAGALALALLAGWIVSGPRAGSRPPASAQRPHRQADPRAAAAPQRLLCLRPPTTPTIETPPLLAIERDAALLD